MIEHSTGGNFFNKISLRRLYLRSRLWVGKLRTGYWPLRQPPSKYEPVACQASSCILRHALHDYASERARPWWIAIYWWEMTTKTIRLEQEPWIIKDTIRHFRRPLLEHMNWLELPSEIRKQLTSRTSCQSQRKYIREWRQTFPSCSQRPNKRAWPVQFTVWARALYG